MHWFMSFGQIVAGVLGIISALWMIGGSILLVLKVLARNEYSVDGDNWTSDPGSRATRSYTGASRQTAASG